MSGSAMAAARRDFERRRTPRLGTTDAGIFGQTPGFHHNIEFRRCQCLRGKGACPIAHFKRGPSCRGRRPRRPAGTRMGPHNGPSKGPVPPGGFIRRTAPAGPPPLLANESPPSGAALPYQECPLPGNPFEESRTPRSYRPRRFRVCSKIEIFPKIHAAFLMPACAYTLLIK